MDFLAQMSPLTIAALAFALGLPAGLLIARAVMGKTRATLEAQTHTLSARLDEKIAQAESANEKIAELRESLADRTATLRAREESIAQERESLTKLRGELEERFKALAHESFRASQKSFLELANETFQKHKTSANADLEQRQEKIAGLLKPVQETLSRYEESLKAIEKARSEAYGSLTQELKSVAAAQQEVRAETSKLVTALRAQPKTRGRWGEQQLERVMELAGMAAHVDFTREATMADADDNRLRPDAVIHLPGDRTIVVDAKTSLSAYFDAIEAENEDDRELFLHKHAAEVRSHAKKLGAKSYWSALERTPDFVAMFVPGENFFAAAIERDPGLFEDAVNNRVLIVTPTTLIALAKAVAFGWRQEAMAENAREVAKLGQELHKRIATMGEHVTRTGKGLEGAVRAYNDMVGSLERMVLPKARAFEDLQVAASDKEIAPLEPVETEPRALTASELIQQVDGGEERLPPSEADSRSPGDERGE